MCRTLSIDRSHRTAVVSAITNRLYNYSQLIGAGDASQRQMNTMSKWEAQVLRNILLKSSAAVYENYIRAWYSCRNSLSLDGRGRLAYLA